MVIITRHLAINMRTFTQHTALTRTLGVIWKIIPKLSLSLFLICGWSGSAKVLGKLPVLGRPTNLDYSRARACCACSWCGCGLFEHFFSRLSFLCSLLSPSLWETARYRLKYCLKGPKTTIQLTFLSGALTNIVLQSRNKVGFHGKQNSSQNYHQYPP